MRILNTHVHRFKWIKCRLTCFEYEYGADQLIVNCTSRLVIQIVLTSDFSDEFTPY